MTTIFESIDELSSSVGQHLGHGEWMEITQDRIDQFAAATGDDQWIHVDAEKAAAGPFGTTIAHGYLTLSLTNKFLPDIFEVRNVSMGINYGVNKVRFPSPVPVGSRIRVGAELAECSEIAGGVQTIMKVVVEIEGSEKPACVAEAVSRFLA